MANYIKEYKVLNRNYGIEDFQAPGEHFFNGKDINEKRLPRFMLWAGGCGIGHAGTLEEANDKLFIYIYREVCEKLRAAESTFQECKNVLNILVQANNLVHFKLKKGNKNG